MEMDVPTYERKSAHYQIPVPIWKPIDVHSTPVQLFLSSLGFSDWHTFQKWSYTQPGTFWESVIQHFNIQWEVPYNNILELSDHPDNDRWCTNGKLNIIESLLQHVSHDSALELYTETKSNPEIIRYATLSTDIKRYAAYLSYSLQIQPQERVLFCLPFSTDGILLYLSLIYIGAVPVLVADSFSAFEIEERRQLVQANKVISTPHYTYQNKPILLSDKIRSCNFEQIIWVDAHEEESTSLLKEKYWSALLKSPQKAEAKAYYNNPDDAITLLFSSGTTKTPKIIPWTSLTPIKCAMDGWLIHQFAKGERVTWTTGMGWMMAPWLLFAGLFNHSTIVLYQGNPTTESYLQFIKKAKITFLGLIPSVVKQWLQHPKELFTDWSVKYMSSTGEPSNKEDYIQLSERTSWEIPIIEYCGGTEIGGGYISSTILLPIAPGYFNSAVPGIHLSFIDTESGLESASGSVFIQTPSLGLSQKLLNYSHAEEYYHHPYKDKNGRALRKHGDAFHSHLYESTIYYSSKGRSDDSMNLGGIKISCLEIETALIHHPLIQDVAAIGMMPLSGGPEELHIVIQTDSIDLDWKSTLQKIISNNLNPLFKIKAVHIWDTLPRTSSQKLQRKEIQKKLY
ncbi:MAG: AMP-binding protein [Cytophagaceae bacterium]|jgi:acetyl-CoA synthetase|nr:AMP-binding protein [Cytophagaceae bacterium]